MGLNKGQTNSGSFKKGERRSKKTEIKIENNIQNVQEGFYCDELWYLNNGITLCKKCHYEKHENIGGDIKP